MEANKFFGGPEDPNMPRMPQPNPAERQALQMDCQQNVQEFIQRNADMVKKHASSSSPASNPEDMLFFLHVPRTAGRTFFSCFLKLGLPPSRRCAKSYDLLRLNVSMSGCGLLSSHDDYSVAEFLPETSAIITQVLILRLPSPPVLLSSSSPPSLPPLPQDPQY